MKIREYSGGYCFSIKEGGKAELQKTRDELNHLKGEQGKPKFSVPKKNIDVSSENERQTPIPRGERKSKEKLSKIKINVTEDCKVDPSILPEEMRS